MSFIQLNINYFNLFIVGRFDLFPQMIIICAINAVKESGLTNSFKGISCRLLSLHTIGAPKNCVKDIEGNFTIATNNFIKLKLAPPALTAQSELTSSEQLRLCYVIAWSAAILKHSTFFPLCLDNIIFDFTLIWHTTKFDEFFGVEFRLIGFESSSCYLSDTREIRRVVEYHDNQLSDQKVFSQQNTID